MEKTFTKVVTDDGSPTFSYLNKELMHHKKGAFLETIHTYLPVLYDLKTSKLPFILTNVGLGLAYIEIICVAFFIKYSIKKTDYSLYSYESNSFLKDSFQKFCQGKLNSQNMNNIYECIVLKAATYFCISQKSIKDILEQVIQKNITLKSGFTSRSKNKDSSHGIFFDAFSPKTSEDLWSEDTLYNLMSNNISHEKCIFSSYAKNHLLKKALKSQGFSDLHKIGFQKRHCTYAKRG